MENENDTRKLVIGALATDSFVSVNKKIIRYFKGDANLALVLCEVLSIYEMQKRNGNVNELDAFPLPIRLLEKNLGMSAFKQKNAIERLQADNILLSTLEGMPACRYITINFDIVQKMLVADETTEADKARKAFYDNLNIAVKNLRLRENPALWGDEPRESIFNACGSMRDELKELIFTFSALIPKDSTIQWSPPATGQLKFLLKENFLHKWIDLKRLATAIRGVKSSVRTEQELITFIKEVNKLIKRIPESAPHFDRSMK